MDCCPNQQPGIIVVEGGSDARWVKEVCYQDPPTDGVVTFDVIDPNPTLAQFGNANFRDLTAINAAGGFTAPFLDTFDADDTGYNWELSGITLRMFRGNGNADQDGVILENVTQGVQSDPRTVSGNAPHTFTMPTGYRHQPGDVYQFAGTIGAAQMMRTSNGVQGEDIVFPPGINNGSWMGATIGVYGPKPRTFRVDENGNWFEIDTDTDTITPATDPAALGLDECPPLSREQEEAIGALVNDPASTEPGNLTIEGDDGEEYTLPLKSEDCYIELGPPAPVAGLNALNMTGDLSDDDFFQAEIENTTAEPLTVTAVRLTTGTWGNPTDNTITGTFAGSTGSVAVGANPGGDFDIPLAPPLVVPANSSVTGFVSSNSFATAQPVTAAAALSTAEIRHIVRTYSDGETDKLIEFNDAGEPEELASVPAGWTPCGPFTSVEEAAIQSLIDDTPDLVTHAIDCYRNNIGVNQMQQDNGGRPIADGAMTWTPTGDVTGEIIIRFDDPGLTPTYSVDLEITDGVTTTTLTATDFGSGFYQFNFGTFSFDGGTTYTLTPSTTIPGILIHDTISSNQAAPQVEFVTPSPSGSIPNIRIDGPGDDLFTVVTLSDGTQTLYDEDGDEVTPFSIAGLVECPDVDDCGIVVERTIIDASAATPGADFALAAPAAGSINGGNSSNPGNSAVQTWIDANLDYTSPDGQQAGIDPPDTTATGQTDGGWVEFWAEIPSAGATLSWTWPGEGWGRIEVDECGCGDYTIADEAYANGTNPTTVSVALDEGLHLVRMTQVDPGGASSAWAYDGSPITTYAASTPPTVGPAQVLASCDGTIAAVDGSPLTGTVIDPQTWPCPTGETCKPKRCCRNADALETTRTLATTWPGPNEVGHMINPAGQIVTLTPANQVGATVSAPVEFIGQGCGNIPALLTVERITGLNGGFNLGVDGRLSHFANNSDFFVTVEVLPDVFGRVFSLPFALNASSIGATEAITFLADNPVTAFERGGGGQDISAALPYVGGWNNNNNNAQSGFSFDAATSLRFRKNGTVGASATLSFGSLQMPAVEEFDACDVPAMLDARFAALEQAPVLPLAGAFADDAAAAAAGVVAGEFFQSDGSGVAPLDVAGIVLVKQ